MNLDGLPDLVVTSSYSNTVTMLLNQSATTAVKTEPRPARFALAAAKPNLFRSSIALTVDVPSAGRVLLEVHDTEGRRVRTLEHGVLAPGRYTRTWDGATEAGSRAKPGVYFILGTALDAALTRKVLLVR